MKLYNLTYFLREGVHSIFSHRLMSIAAISVITACLILMGSFTLVAANIDMIMDDIESKNEIVAYVEETYDQTQAAGIESQIMGIPDVTAVIFTTKDEALSDFKERLGDQSGLLDNLDSRNPLRDRYTVTIGSIENTQEVADRLGEITGIAKVSARSDISDKIVQVRDVITVVSATLIIMLVLVSIFIISNTVNLTMFNRREEIAIMKMIGATNGFVRFPFIIEGVLIGICGALLAFGIQWGIYEYISANAFTILGFVQLVPFGEVVRGIIVLFFGTGLLVGGAGSAMTLRKFLKV